MKTLIKNGRIETAVVDYQADYLELEVSYNLPLASASGQIEKKTKALAEYPKEVFILSL